MIMEHIRFDRLEALATHLESGALGHDDFYFGYFRKEADCGTAGCALGECLTLWPNEWEWDYFCQNTPVLKGHNSDESIWESTMKWFGIDRMGALHLFCHEFQRPYKYGGKMLSSDATRYEVAENIREFIRVMRTGIDKQG